MDMYACVCVCVRVCVCVCVCMCACVCVLTPIELSDLIELIQRIYMYSEY